MIFINLSSILKIKIKIYLLHHRVKKTNREMPSFVPPNKEFSNKAIKQEHGKGKASHGAYILKILCFIKILIYFFIFDMIHES